jgi:cobalt-zinc-cadmium efflux system protein
MGRLTVALVLAGGSMVAEIIGGYLANSLALLADAGHMLTDVAALGLTLFTIWFARRPPDARHTYGYHRAEILAALVNGATLLAISFYIFVEAYHRLREPPAVQGAVLMGIAIGGLLVNLVSLWILNAGRHENLNIHGAWLHVLTDALGSVGAIVAGLLVWLFKWEWADPALSVLIGLLVIYSAWSLVRQSVSVLMEAVPPHLDQAAIRGAMCEVRGVSGVHDLHVWSISSGKIALSAHVDVDTPARQDDVLRQLRTLIAERFDIEHTTLQLETEFLTEKEIHSAPAKRKA